MGMKMGERNLLESKHIMYEGLFDAAELYKLIDNWIRDHGYDKKEINNTEQVTKKGRDLNLFLEPARAASDYFQYIQRIVVTLVGMARPTRQHQFSIRFLEYIERRHHAIG